MSELFTKLTNRQAKIAVVGLGYVGLPLAMEFGKKFDTIGFDISEKKVRELNQGFDSNNEISSEEFAATNVFYTNDPAKLREADFIIVAVPTPIDDSKKPDLTPVYKASVTVGKNLKPGAIIVYESTVYPGVTEEECVPILEKESGLKWHSGFKVGYSPERINPGDKVHTVTNILKVVSGEDAETLDIVAEVYGSVITAGVFKAASIKVAEAAKVIENTQRDLNIALMNELSIIFNKMDINTYDVLEAAGTKWNFIKMTPGLVGGHCIGVDPYYLTHKAEMLGYHPQVILAGRRINDSMGNYVAEQTVKMMIKAGKAVKDARVLIMGFTFKENVSDIRNTRVIDVVNELKEYGCHVFITDPLSKADEVRHEYGLELSDFDDVNDLDAIVIATPHDEYRLLSKNVLVAKLRNGNTKKVVVDIKGVLRDQLEQADSFVYRML